MKEMLCQHSPFVPCVTSTTRTRRPSEQEGVDYFFLKPEEFREQINKGYMMEHEEVYPGVFYGTPWTSVYREDDKIPVIVMDVKGALHMKEMYPSMLLIALRSPSLQVLEKRLKSRGSDTENSIRTRLEKASLEMDIIDSSEIIDCYVMNDVLEPAFLNLRNISLAYADELRIHHLTEEMVDNGSYLIHNSDRTFVDNIDRRISGKEWKKIASTERGLLKVKMQVLRESNELHTDEESVDHI